MRAEIAAFVAASGGALTACALVLGIDSVGYTSDAPREASVDAEGTDGRAGDAAASMPCDPDKPFDPPTRVRGLENDSYLSVSLSHSQLEAYVALHRPLGDGGETDWQSALVVRSDLDASFGFPNYDIFANINATAGESFMNVTDDGLTSYFTRANVGIWIGQRADASAPFQAPMPVPSLANAEEPSLSPNGRALYYVERVAFWRYDLALGSSRSVYQRSDTSEGVHHPVISADETALYFSTDRSSDAGTNFGGTNIWLVRGETTAPFDPSSARPVSELNSDVNDDPLWLSADGCTIYLRSPREGGMYRIYVAHKQR